MSEQPIFCAECSTPFFTKFETSMWFICGKACEESLSKKMAKFANNHQQKISVGMKLRVCINGLELNRSYIDPSGIYYTLNEQHVALRKGTCGVVVGVEKNTIYLNTGSFYGVISCPIQLASSLECVKEETI
jgi:hypothetical protein